MYKFKKNIWLWTAVERESKRLIGFEVGTRETKYFKKLLKNISHIKAKKYASDYWKAYNLIDREKRLIGKSHTYNVERMNRLLRHYLARFNRKTYCYSKSLSIIEDPVLFYFHIVILFVFSNAIQIMV